MPESKLYAFLTHIGASCARQMQTFQDLSEKLKMDVHQLMRECNGHDVPSKALVKGLARELEIDEKFLANLAEEIWKDFAAKGKDWSA